eukprot:m.230894 g.230894  ORF g.230894 m.230894 type:complete len:211 (-) comp13893_c0_seq2:59-691(-)
MPPKKKKSVKGKKKGKKKGSAKPKGPAPPPNYKGLRPGGMVMKVIATNGQDYIVAELAISTVAELKNRIREVSGFPTETMHLFKADDNGRPVADLEGFSNSWTWDPTLYISELNDEFTLRMSGLMNGAELLLLYKNTVLRRSSSFIADPLLSSSPSHTSSRRPSTIEMFRRLSSSSVKSLPTQNSVARGKVMEQNLQLIQEREESDAIKS